MLSISISYIKIDGGGHGGSPPTPPTIDNAILLESGDFILLESGSYILLESA